MRFRVRTLCIALVIVVLSARNATGQTTITFVSDASWTSFVMNPDGSQGTTLGAPQFPLWAFHYADLSAIPGAQWMWRPGVNESTISDLQGAYFSKQFNLPGVPVGGSIQIAVDDYAEVVVNGSIADSTGSVTDYSRAASAQSHLKFVDLTPYLVSGLNTLTIKAQNGPYTFAPGCNPCTYDGSQNPAGVVFGGSLTYDAATPAKHATWGSLKAHYR